MKYILYPFWVILVIIYTMIEFILFVLLNLIEVLWNFKISKNFMSWQYWTQGDTVWRGNYDCDKNVWSTIARYITFGERRTTKKI